MKRFIETVNDDEVKNIIEAKIINKRWTGAHVSVTKDTVKSARADNQNRRQAKRKELGLENVEEGTALQVKMALSDAGLKGKWKNNKVYVDKKDVDSAKKALKGNVIYRGKPPEVVAEDSSPVVEIVPAIVGGIAGMAARSVAKKAVGGIGSAVAGGVASGVARAATTKALEKKKKKEKDVEEEVFTHHIVQGSTEKGKVAHTGTLKQMQKKIKDPKMGRNHVLVKTRHDLKTGDNWKKHHHAEEVVDESTAEYAKSLEKIAKDKQLKMLSKSEKSNLLKIADLLSKEKKEEVEVVDERSQWTIKNTKTGQLYSISRYQDDKKLKKIQQGGGDHKHAAHHKDGKPVEEKIVTELSPALLHRAANTARDDAGHQRHVSKTAASRVGDPNHPPGQNLKSKRANYQAAKRDYQTFKFSTAAKKKEKKEEGLEAEASSYFKKKNKDKNVRAFGISRKKGNIRHGEGGYREDMDEGVNLRSISDKKLIAFVKSFDQDSPMGQVAGTQLKNTKKEMRRRGLEEKLTKKSSMGDYVDDFQKSDAPQFKGKSKDERRKMAIAAKLNA